MQLQITQTTRLRPPVPTLVLAAALLLAPAAGRADTIYVSSYKTITRFMSDGSSSVFATGLSIPHGLAFDGAGNLYVANYGDGTIVKFTPGGVRSVFASTGLNRPMGMAFDRAGNLYVANEGSWDPVIQNSRSYIEKFTPGGVGSFFADAAARGPNSLVCDSAGNVYATCSISYYGDIMKYTPDGVGSVFVTTGLFDPTGLALDSAGNFYVGCGYSDVIEKFSPSGTDLGVFASVLGNPAGLAFDSADNLYVANYYGSGGYIEKFTPDGMRSVFATGLVWPIYIAIIPEPSTCALLGLGLLALVGFRRRTP